MQYPALPTTQASSNENIFAIAWSSTAAKNSFFLIHLLTK
jgi:hypothetical protein